MVTMYETAEAKQYKIKFKKHIIEEIKNQNIKWIPNTIQHFYIDCIFYFDRIDKDPNNYFKLLLDSITETQLIWCDDNVTCERVNRIYYDSQNPRIEILIYPVDYIGIFDNQEQLDNFKKSNCIQCSRYKDGKCSLFVKAMEGRIQEELNNIKCNKLKKIKGDLK